MLKIKLLSLAIMTTVTFSLSHTENFKVLKQISDTPILINDGAYKNNYDVPDSSQNSGQIIPVKII